MPTYEAGSVENIFNQSAPLKVIAIVIDILQQ
jgi:hypothetical protein